MGRMVADRPPRESSNSKSLPAKDFETSLRIAPWGSRSVTREELIAGALAPVILNLARREASQ